MCESTKKGVELFSFVCWSASYTMKFHSLDQLVEDIRRFQEISFLDALAYEQSNVHFNRASRVV